MRIWCFLSLSLLVCGCKKEVEQAKPVIRPVLTIQVQSGVAGETFQTTGSVKARYETDLSFRVGGKVLDRKVEVGDVVRPGQILADLEPDDYRLAVQAADAALAMAEAERKQALADEKRNRDLSRTGAISSADYDRFQAIADAQSKRVEQARSQLELAKNRLIYTQLKSDHAGIVTSVYFDSGKVVAEGQPILTLARTGEIEAVVSIPENKVEWCQNGQAKVSLWRNNQTFIPAKLRELAPNADASTRTYLARFTLLNPPAEVRLGMTATVHLSQEKSSQANLFQVPLSAVFNAGKGPRVWIADAAAGRVKERPVEVKEYLQETAIISGGLVAGERIVTAGTHKLDENLTVRIVEQEAKR